METRIAPIAPALTTRQLAALTLLYRERLWGMDPARSMESRWVDAWGGRWKGKQPALRQCAEHSVFRITDAGIALVRSALQGAKLRRISR